MARAGETVELAEREVTIHGLDLVAWDDTDPERPIAIVEVACSAGTYVRALARDLGAALGSGAYLGALTRTAAGRSGSRTPSRSTTCARPRPPGPRAWSRSLRPIDAGLEAFPEVALTAAEVDAVARGQFVPPSAGLPPAAEHYRLRGPDEALVAIATRRGRGSRPRRCSPRRPRRTRPRARPTTRPRPPVPARREADARRVGRRRPGPGGGPVFVAVGVFDGLHLGHQYLLRDLVVEATARDARPTVITFDHHPDEVLTGHAPPLLIDPDERLERLADIGVEVTVVQHFDAALRQTPYDAFVERIRARVGLAGFLMTPDAAFGFERRGTPETLAALGVRDGFEVVVVPPFTLDGRPVRSSEIRAAIAAGDLATAESLLGRPVTLTGSLGGDGALTFGCRWRSRRPAGTLAGSGRSPVDDHGPARSGRPGGRRRGDGPRDRGAGSSGRE